MKEKHSVNEQQLKEFEKALMLRARDVRKRQTQLYKKPKIELINILIELETWFGIKAESPLIIGRVKKQ
jgi:hypothetical protein